MKSTPSAWPRLERRPGYLAQLLAGRATGSLHRHALKNRCEIAGQSRRVRTGGRVAFLTRAFEPLAQHRFAVRLPDLATGKAYASLAIENKSSADRLASF